MERKSGSALQKLYKLQKPIKGYEMVIVSCKPNGADGLRGSYFIWGSRNEFITGKELDWDTEDCNFNHEQVLMNLIRKEIKSEKL